MARRRRWIAAGGAIALVVIIALLAWKLDVPFVGGDGNGVMVETKGAPTATSEERVREIVTEEINKAAAANPAITESQVKKLIDKAVADAKIGGLTETQIRDIATDILKGATATSTATPTAPATAATAPAAPQKAVPTPQACETIDCRVRVPSGVTGTTSFNAGDPVAGLKLTMGNVERDGCFYRFAPADGKVFNGVVHYWPAEVANLPPCQ